MIEDLARDAHRWVGLEVSPRASTPESIHGVVSFDCHTPERTGTCSWDGSGRSCNADGLTGGGMEWVSAGRLRGRIRRLHQRVTA
jgi:hypothetical protein